MRNSRFQLSIAMYLQSPLQNRLLRARQAAEYLCMSERKLRRLIQNGELTANPTRAFLTQ
jgi:hypothetical protein